MKRLLLQSVLLVLLFFGTWFLISRIDFMKRFSIREKIEVNEKKLGDLLWSTFEESEILVRRPEITGPVEAFKKKLCEANGLSPDSIRVYIVDKKDVNAFAFPGRRLVLFTGLIEACETPEELCGVMAHEIAHIEKQHVMKKLAKEAGIGILAAITGNAGSSEVLRQVLRMLSSRAYDRSLEEEADQTAVDYLCEAGIGSEHLSHFFLRLSEKEKLPELLTWVSTHPGLKERAAEILRQQKKQRCKKEQLLEPDAWKTLQEAVRSLPAR
ncbi:MAG TPA: M48 family metallopeptidase [Lacibacter sp.]|nr:M48 family metallopeptidase [Lacibacter sp.]HMO89092.1 M48 family metallopeptidase [Lacibacter sp.]HMP87257.1 M48 family metallopeptidase [Lacibacter sp.]